VIERDGGKEGDTFAMEELLLLLLLL